MGQITNTNSFGEMTNRQELEGALRQPDVLDKNSSVIDSIRSKVKNNPMLVLAFVAGLVGGCMDSENVNEKDAVLSAEGAEEVGSSLKFLSGAYTTDGLHLNFEPLGKYVDVTFEMYTLEGSIIPGGTATVNTDGRLIINTGNMIQDVTRVEVFENGKLVASVPHMEDRDFPTTD